MYGIIVERHNLFGGQVKTSTYIAVAVSEAVGTEFELLPETYVSYTDARAEAIRLNQAEVDRLFSSVGAGEDVAQAM